MRRLAIALLASYLLAIGAASVHAPKAAADTASGTSHDDLIIGTPKADELRGLGGRDEIRGKGGADLLIGGNGSDLLRGNNGRDTIRGGLGNDVVETYGDGKVDHVFCGPGLYDVVDADPFDVVAANCELRFAPDPAPERST